MNNQIIRGFINFSEDLKIKNYLNTIFLKQRLIFKTFDAGSLCQWKVIRIELFQWTELSVH